MIFSVNYEARLEDGTLISKSDGVEFTVEKGGCSLPLKPRFLNFKRVSEFSHSACTRRVFLSCLCNICEDNEEGRESVVDCKATMYVDQRILFLLVLMP